MGLDDDKISSDYEKIGLDEKSVLPFNEEGDYEDATNSVTEPAEILVLEEGDGNNVQQGQDISQEEYLGLSAEVSSEENLSLSALEVDDEALLLSFTEQHGSPPTKSEIEVLSKGLSTLREMLLLGKNIPPPVHEQTETTESSPPSSSTDQQSEGSSHSQKGAAITTVVHNTDSQTVETKFINQINAPFDAEVETSSSIAQKKGDGGKTY
eukprot:TRINITY_DN93342_c0_g1_i3.p1 TRINITY_DN93342_c0_g1~~TRINITY_DN93342_c0_g1_i3.p1  ORF type:complete len:241 (-),score=38.41 TRINITY_DN93342_c0_g1_i3:362-991(-)